jgi:hypothetical protein
VPQDPCGTHAATLRYPAVMARGEPGLTLRRLGPQVAFEGQGTVMSDNTSPQRSSWWIFVVLSLYLLGQALWRVLGTGGEWPRPMMRNIEIGLDALLAVLVVILFTQVREQLPSGDSRRIVANVLVVAAVIAALAMFAIRFTSEAGWATGFLRN